MADINPTYFDRVRYTLQHELSDSVTIKEPEGWDNDDKEYARVKDYAGIFAKFSNNLRFVGDSADYITFHKDVYGINAKIRLTKEVAHPQTDIFEKSYSGVLDLSTYSKKKGQVSVKFNASGLQQLIKAREKKKIEIDRTETLDGDAIDPINKEILIMTGREIFLKSDFDVSPTNNDAHTSVESDAGNTRDQTVGFPLRIKTNSHQEILASVLPQSNGTETIGDLGMMIIFDIDRDRTFDIKIKGTFDAFVQRYERIQWAYCQLCLTIYQDGFDHNLKQRIVLEDISDYNSLFGINADYEMDPYRIDGIPFEYENSALALEKGDSLSLELILKADMHFANNAGVRVFAENIIGGYDAGAGKDPIILKLNEESNYPVSAHKVLLAHELTNQMVEIMTGRNDAFYSPELGRAELSGYSEDGIAAYTGFNHGFWLRGFDELPLDDENRYKSLTLSFKDLMGFYKVALGLDLGIQLIAGDKERIIIRDRQYFFNSNVTVRLPFQIQKVKRSVAKDLYFSEVTAGYAKGGEYEEAVGLDEPNAQSSWDTVITRITSTLKLISKIRTDLYGGEFARRKPIRDYATEDTSYDKDVWAWDMKRWQNYFLLRTWEDDFSQAPENVFSPRTAGNLRFSPFNILFYKHGWEIASSFVQYPTDYFRYGSSVANSRMKTRIIGGDAYAENEKEVLNNLFQKAKFVNEWIEFEHVVDHDLLKQVEGSSIILGEEVPNFYGLFEFINEDNVLERGFLFSLKPNKKGKWKILKANR